MYIEKIENNNDGVKIVFENKKKRKNFKELLQLYNDAYVTEDDITDVDMMCMALQEFV